MVLQCMHMVLKISENYLLGGWWGGGGGSVRNFYFCRGVILLGEGVNSVGGGGASRNFEIKMKTA